MVLEVEGGYKVDNPSIGQVIDEISSLNGLNKSFMVLENSLGSYIQVGGGPEQFTVEVRIYSSAEEFEHWKAERVDLDSNQIKSIYIAGSQVKVKERQILDKNTVKKLFESFADGELLCTNIKWFNITSMFN